MSVRGVAAESDLQRRLFRPRRADRWRPRQGDRTAAHSASARTPGSSSSSPRPQTIRGLTLVVAGGGGRGFGRGAGGNSGRALEASDDGPQFRTVTPIPAGGAAKPPSRFRPSPRILPRDVPDVAASAGRPRRLRRNAEPRPRGACRTARTRRDPDRRARPAPGGRASTASKTRRPSPPPPTCTPWRPPPCLPPTLSRKADVIDLTSKMHPDGTLDWTPPAGHWVVLRLGYSLHRRTNSPGLARSHRPRSGQAQQGLRQGVSRQLPGPVQGHGRPADGQARPAVRDHRQLGGRRAELDRRHDRGVHQAPRLRHAPVAAGAHRPRGGKRRSERPLPLGLPPDHRRPDGREPLRPAHRRAARARHGPLQRIARVRPRLHRRRHGGRSATPTFP